MTSVNAASVDRAASKAPAPAPAEKKTASRFRMVYTQERAMTVVLILLIIIFALLSPVFLTVTNVLTMAAGSAFIAIAAVGLTALFIVGEFDLSVGATYGITATVIAYTEVNYTTPLIALIVGLVVAVLIGFINGVVTAIGNVPSFIVTIGMLSVLEGLSQFISAGQPITMDKQGLNSPLAAIASAAPGGLSFSVIVAIVVFLIAAFILRSTKLGAHLYLTGGNAKAARQVGINASRVKILTFTITGLLAGIAGAVSIFGLGSAQPGTGGGDFLFQAVGAAIIGGVALTGGAGSVYGTFIGAAILAVLNNGLVLAGVDPSLGITITGTLIVLAGLLQAGIRRALASLFVRGRTRAAKSTI